MVEENKQKAEEFKALMQIVAGGRLRL